MKKINVLIWIMVVAGIVSACKPESNTKIEQETERVKPVRVSQLRKDTIERKLSYTANLEAWENVYFAPATPGRIQEIFVEEGDRVLKGQKLLQMDQTELTQALIQLENARINFQRMDTLNNLNSISKQQYDQAKMQYDLAQENIEFLRENTSLEAPFTGVITGKYYEDGEMYSGAPNTQIGKAAVVAMMQISPLKVKVSLSEKNFPTIRKGMKANIYSDIYPNETFQGEINRVYPTIDPATRTFLTELKIDNPNEKLRPGMFVSVEIKIKDEAALMVPAISVIKQEGTNNRYVFIAEEGKAKKIQVEMGDRYNDQVEIISDELTAGMNLIVAGQASLKQGDTIKINNTNESR